jgi:hypothetical protein
VKAVASSVEVIVKLLAAPRLWIALMPLGMDEWRKPAVLEKTSTLKGASAERAGTALIWLNGIADSALMQTAATKERIVAGSPDMKRSRTLAKIMREVPALSAQSQLPVPSLARHSNPVEPLAARTGQFSFGC